MIVALITSTSDHNAVDLQAASIQRRLGVSPSAARLYVSHAFGNGQRGDVARLAAITANRIAASTGARS